MPISTLIWRDAIVDTIMDKVDVLESYEDWQISSQNITMLVPSVVMSRKWVPSGRTVRFSSHNVYLRDDFTCQYCGEVFPEHQLTKEHVIPKFLGGLVKWDNIVAACRPCNQRKSHHTVMKPRNPPRKPSYGEMVSKIKRFPITIRHPSWQSYLDWPAENIKLVGDKR
jgi:5-methylcytosine-specific restriction endonuclease McrA